LVAPLLTLAAGVAIADGIREASGLAVSLKWPNDVYVGTRKLAGILAEAGTSGSGLNYVVLGIGINLMSASYPPDIVGRATSVEVELARPVDRGLLLATCLAALVERSRQLASGSSGTVITAWRRYGSDMFGRVVEFTVGSEIVAGIAENVDEHGALLVRTADRLVPVMSGQVRWQ